MLLLRVRGHHPALARGDLLVRVEGENRRGALRAHRLALVPGAERLARVLDQREAMPVADRAQLVELARVPVDVDGDDGLRSLGDGGLDRGRVEVQRSRVDVREHGRRALVDRAVRRGDERVRARDHLVAGLESGRDAEEVQSRRAARHGSRVRRADRLGERLLEALDRRAEREPARVEDLGDELLLAIVDPGCAQADDAARGLVHARAGAISTTSSQSVQRSSMPFTAAR